MSRSRARQADPAAAAPIVLLSLPADRDRAGVVIDAFVEAGLDAVWLSAPPGEMAAVERRALKARCAIFCWSAATADKAAAAYRRLAGKALARGIAIGVELDQRTRPLGIETMSCYQLARGATRRSGLSWLLAGRLFMNDIVVAAKYKAAGRDPPPPSAPRKLLLRQAWIGLVAVGGVAATLSAPAQLYQSVPWPRFNEERAWAAVRPGSCPDLAAFRRAFPDGRYAARAAAVLADPVEVVRHRWRRLERELPMTVDADGGGRLRTASTLAERARPEMELLCRGYARAAGGEVAGMRLRERANGSSYDTVVCTLRVPDPEAVRICDVGVR